jgi:hypothetical protein
MMKSDTKIPLQLFRLLTCLPGLIFLAAAALSALAGEGESQRPQQGRAIEPSQPPSDQQINRPDLFSPSRITIWAHYSGWVFGSTNLTLVSSNGVYAAGAYRVAPSLITNLVTAALRPWPKPGTNAWPRFKIEPANLGLNEAWLRTNYARLLQYHTYQGGTVPFPNASDRQRAWLTNALTDLNLLREAVLSPFRSFHTDDYPELELRFEKDVGQTVAQVFRLSTKAQQPFMLPWQVYDGTNEVISGNADISRALFQILPPGFLNRNRLDVDTLRIAATCFLSHPQVYRYLYDSTLEQTFGEKNGSLRLGFQMTNSWISGDYRKYPETFEAVFHHTSWPARFAMPVHVRVQHGVAVDLKTVLENAQARVAPLLEHKWLASLLNGSTNVSMEVLQGSPDQPWLRGHMQEVGRVAFYDRIRPALQRSLGFRLREAGPNVSEWALLEDGRLLLYKFSGDGVLDWAPDELGFYGTPVPNYVQTIAVFVGPGGTITEVVPAERK